MGIEDSLPATYSQLFEVTDKASNEYVVIAHRATVDLVQAANEAGKNGQIQQKFRYLRLTNHLFPHRGDVSSSFKNAGEELVEYLNRSVLCNEDFESALSDLKLSAPILLQSVDQKKCENIQAVVRDVPSELLTQENELSWENERSYAELPKKIIAGTITEFEKRKAFTGHLRFDSLNILRTRDNTLIVEFELTRKHNLINKLDQLDPIKLEAKFFSSGKVYTYPLKLISKDTAGFEVWLRTFNLFLHPQYPVRDVAFKNVHTPIEFESKELAISLGRDPSGDRLSNRWVFENLPKEIVQMVKKVIVQ